MQSLWDSDVNKMHRNNFKQIQMLEHSTICVIYLIFRFILLLCLYTFHFASLDDQV